MPGRKPTPTNLRILRGNPGKRGINHDEPMPEAPDRAPAPPNYLNRRAKAEWRRMVAELLTLGLLTRLDIGVLSGYCMAFGNATEASYRLRNPDKWVQVGDTGGTYMNTWMAIQSMALKQMKAFAVELGMSPSSRSRVKVTKPAEKDAFEELKNRGKSA